MGEILLIDKPKGITSFDVIRILRKKLGIKKMGHAGTLDPLATGLLIVATGDRTKALRAYTSLPKEYLAEILIGERTTTGDMEGRVIERKAVSGLTRAVVTNALKTMEGVLRLPVSPYSAIKRGGIPLYVRARKAEMSGAVITDVPVREMCVLSAHLISLSCRDERCIARIRVRVGSGTYVRSLAEELGRRLGYPATIRNLRRTKIGNYDVSEAYALI